MPINIKILSLIPYKILPARLGGEKGIALFNEYLGKIVPLIAVTIKNNSPLLVGSYRLLNIISNSRLRYINPFLFLSIRKILKKEKSTHLIIEHPYFGWLAWLIGITTSVKWIVHSHNIEYMRSKSIGRWWWMVLKWYEGWVYRKADTVFFISEDDCQFALTNLKNDLVKSFVVTYGIEQSSAPVNSDKERELIRSRHDIQKNEKILLFNGALYHSTNYEALNIILQDINPLLLAENNFKYKIIVCGKGLPDFFHELKEYKNKNIIYAGFVDDISSYFQAADIFLNPILSGGGVKTKAIEALAMNCMVVSTELGAKGIKQEVCGTMLKVAKEGEWTTFAALITNSDDQKHEIPSTFFEYYYWGNVVERALKTIS